MFIGAMAETAMLLPRGCRLASVNLCGGPVMASWAAPSSRRLPTSHSAGFLSRLVPAKASSSEIEHEQQRRRIRCAALKAASPPFPRKADGKSRRLQQNPSPRLPQGPQRSLMGAPMRFLSAGATPKSGAGEEGEKIHVEVAVDVEGNLKDALADSGFSSIQSFVEAVEEDAAVATKEALAMEEKPLQMHEGAELSVLLCDDSAITKLNREWREKDTPTDVLSFPGFDDQPPGYPLQVLGDLIISLDMAKAQAEERGYTLQQEVRVLLVHGIFHLLGYDHELGEEEMVEMAGREVECFKRLGWHGEGLITRCGSPDDELHGEQDSTSQVTVSKDTDGETSSSVSDDSSEMFVVPSASDIKMLAIDMDGTLLNSSSQVTARTAKALRAAMGSGVQVILATGKARPAAIAAMEKVDLAGAECRIHMSTSLGTGLVVGEDQPGVFLQGLAVYGKGGELLQSDSLPAPVVLLCFEHAYENNIPICAFLGDECVTIKMTPELEQLHSTYYEPLAKVVNGMEDIFSGPPVKKILFMTDPEYVSEELLPFLDEELEDSGAQTCQAVPNMLEVVPEGINKWVGMKKLLKDFGLKPNNVMAIGDGLNDLELVKNSGFGVAMANAVPQVLGVADAVSTSNDEDGVAEAIQQLLQSSSDDGGTL